jgi:hypothetical protein
MQSGKLYTQNKNFKLNSIRKHGWEQNEFVKLLEKLICITCSVLILWRELEIELEANLMWLKVYNEDIL